MKDNQILLIGIGAVIAWMSAKKYQDNFIGKLEDQTPPRGGRIDQYWRSKLRVRPSKIIGRKIDQHDIGNKYPILADKLISRYELHGIEFGNWMNQNDRAEYMIGISVGLSDLARCLNISQKKIGQGILSIASGARGKSRAMAHFEGGTYNAINLTKKYGSKGVLAHEFGHFIDRKLEWPSGHRSVRMRPDLETKYDRRDVRGHMEQVIKLLYFDDNMNPTSYFKMQYNQTMYYKYRSEVWARCFEVYILIRLQELGLRNDFLMENKMRWDLPEKKLVRKARPFIEKIIKAAF